MAGVDGCLQHMAGSLTMDTLGLFSIDVGSVAVDPVKPIKNYNPAYHSPKSWTTYKDGAQKRNWVRVDWTNADKAGRANGTTNPAPSSDRPLWKYVIQFYFYSKPPMRGGLARIGRAALRAAL